MYVCVYIHIYIYITVSTLSIHFMRSMQPTRMGSFSVTGTSKYPHRMCIESARIDCGAVVRVLLY